MKRIRIHAGSARDSTPIIRQTSLQNNLEALEAPAIPQAQTHEVGEAVEDVVVRWYSEYDGFDERAGSLMERGEGRLQGVLDEVSFLRVSFCVSLLLALCLSVAFLFRGGRRKERRVRLRFLLKGFDVTN